jgi:hypothetical protein
MNLPRYSCVPKYREMQQKYQRIVAFRSPWQNGVAERWVGNYCRGLLDHLIVVNERHLKRLMSECVITMAPLNVEDEFLWHQQPCVRDAWLSLIFQYSQHSRHRRAGVSPAVERRA